MENFTVAIVGGTGNLGSALALRLAARLAGDTVAHGIQLGIEYERVHVDIFDGGTHADVRFVVPEGLSIGVNEMRSLVLRAASSPTRCSRPDR